MSLRPMTLLYTSAPTAHASRVRSPLRQLAVQIAVLQGAVLTVTVVALAISGSTAPWLHWDATYYVRLALEGYRPWVGGGNHTGLAFLPLYPLLVTLPIHLGLPPLLAAVAVANLCSGAALYALAILVQRDCDEAIARRAVLLLAATPAAIFLHLAYSEGLYLALALGGFVALRRGRWWLAAAPFALALLDRPTAIVLVLPYLVEWWQQRSPSPLRRLVTLCPLTLFPLAYALLAIDQAAQGAAPLSFARMQYTVWHYTWDWPWATVAQQLAALPTLASETGHGLLPTALLNLGAALLALPLLAIAVRRLPPSYTAYALGVLTLTLSLRSAMPFYGHDLLHPFVLPLLSTDRVLLTAFPLAVAASLILRRPVVLIPVIATLATLYLALLLLFGHGLWAG